MGQLVTIPFRLTAERERTLRKELHLTDAVRLTNIMAYYAIRDTVYAWLDGGEADLSNVADATDDLGERRSFTVSERPYNMKVSLKIKRKSGQKKP